jgi:hypothetical protein
MALSNRVSSSFSILLMSKKMTTAAKTINNRVITPISDKTLLFQLG